MSDPLGLAVTLALSAGVGLVSGFFSHKRFAQARQLRNTPTSKVRSAAQGYVEFSGVLETPEQGLLRSPLSATPCLWWQYQIERRVRRDKTYHWQVVERACSSQMLLLRDQTGTCLIDPQDAEVFTGHRKRWVAAPQRSAMRANLLAERYRYTERWLAPGQTLYATGHFQSLQPAQDFDLQAHVGGLIGAWKQDPQGLLKRFDGNLSGRLETYEWDRVQQAALAQAQQAHRLLAAKPLVHLLKRCPQGQPFLLSTQGKQALIRQLRQQGAALALGCVLGLWFGAAVVFEYQRYLTPTIP